MIFPNTMAESDKRINREIKTARAMIKLYCRAHHHTLTKLCDDCLKLETYAVRRLTACPFQEKKTTCGKCSVHCYKPAMKEKIIEVMRYSGPRMIFRHPILALAHLLDAKCSRKEPAVIKNQRIVHHGDKET